MTSQPQKSDPGVEHGLEHPLDPPQLSTSPRITRRHMVWAAFGLLTGLGGLALVSEGFTSLIKYLIMLFIRLFIRLISLIFRF